MPRLPWSAQEELWQKKCSMPSLDASAMTQPLDAPSPLVTIRYTPFYPPCLPGKATTQTPEAFQLLFAGRSQGEDLALHQLLQPHDGQAHRLAVFTHATIRAALDRVAFPGLLY